MKRRDAALSEAGEEAVVIYWRSMRFRLMIGFVMIIVPLVLFLYYNNDYAMNVVRKQVSQSEFKQLSNQIDRIDNMLVDLKHYMLKIVVGDFVGDYTHPDLYSLGIYPEDSGEYFFAKQRIMNQFKTDIGTFKGIHTLFVYSQDKRELIVMHGDKKLHSTLNADIERYLTENRDADYGTWLRVPLDGKQFFMLVIRAISLDVYVGALAEANELLGLIEASGRDAALLTLEGELLAETSPWMKAGIGNMKPLLSPDEHFATLRPPEAEGSYLTVRGAFSELPLYLLLFIPERILLEDLPYFRRLILIIPAAALLLVFGYMLFLHRVLLRPLAELMKGMKRMTMGNLDVRLDLNQTTEFRFMIEAFNQMAAEVQRLKIDVYEKMLQVKEAELKHLQAQINPHFYMNSLNIIHSLATLQEYGLIQKLAKHLQDYFRFTMRNQRNSVTLSEETEHLSNYLEIQRMRFPNRLSFELNVPPPFGDCRVPPLTLQPFVENSIIHGMKKGKDVLHIRVEAGPDPDRPDSHFTVRIADNGYGFAEERLAELERSYETDAVRNEHLGIWNVRRRLAAMFGEPVDIALGNGPDRGAVVELRIPISGRAKEEGGFV